MTSRTALRLAAASLALALACGTAAAQKKYDTGATDTEIKIGNIMPYSGPASAYSLIAKTQQAYFNMVNAAGGINGRKITFISYDDGYSPPKTVEQARKLVESDEVLFVFQPLGTAHNAAIQRYMNTKKVPQLFVATGATRFGDNPKQSPWTMGWQPNYQTEGRIYARYILQTKPDAKIAVLFQNDDYGKDLMKGLRDGLGDKQSLIIAEAGYETSEPTVDSQMVKLKASGADVFVNVATPKFAAQAIRKAAEIGWQPLHILNNVSNSVGAVLRPAGAENAKGVISSGYLKDATDPLWKDDAGMKVWAGFMDKWFPDGDRSSSFTVYGYASAQTLVQVLKACGDDLSRENVMRQAASLKNVALDVAIPGILMNTSATDYFPIEQMQLMRFDGERWNLFGPVLSGELGQ